jgi:DNA gyrase subunit A
MSLPEETQEQIIPIAIEDEMKTSYINYAVYVITHRALPNVYDGLKPVQRRILYAANQLGLVHDKSHKKVSGVVGEVMGKYHPHGDDPIFQALVRLAQPWVMRYPLIDGQGNFGSVDGDSAAAMRYIESRLKRVSEDGLLADLSKEVVDYQPNYDNTLQEPTVLPAPLPNLMVNGCSGIAVGMATNMAPHNLREVVGGICAYIDNPDITIEELMHYIKAPDFPTGGIICGTQGVQSAFETGRGRIVLRGKAEIKVLPNDRQQIVITELPYMVNKAMMIEKAADLINDKLLLGISDVRDESDREGLRVVYDLKKDAIANVVLNNLYKKTTLQSSFSVNNVALVDGVPKILNLKELIMHYANHRHTVVTRKTEARLKHAKHQKHLLEGYLVVIEHVNDIVKIIKESQDAQEAKKNLMAAYKLSEIQTKSILELRLQRLTGFERKRVLKQYEEVEILIKELEGILADKAKRMNIIKEELHALDKRYGDERRTLIEQDASDFAVEDMIPNERMVITLSNQGYIKSTPLTTYRIQNRGGVGAKGSTAKKEDFLSQLFLASAHDYLLIFTEYGKVYWQRVYALPKGKKNTQGRAIQNLLDIEPGDSIQSILRVPNLHDEEYIKDRYVSLCTEKGIIKKTPLEAFARPRQKGIRAITFKENDRLLEARLTGADDYIIMALRSGKAIRFPHHEVRPMGRTAAGVRGITLANEEDKVVGMISAPESKETTLLVLSEKGYGKRSAIQDYRCTHRGGKGVKTIQVTSKTGKLIAIKAVEDQDGLMIMNASGITLRTEVSSLRVMRRATQGVRMLRLRSQDSIASLAVVHNLSETELDDES